MLSQAAPEMPAGPGARGARDREAARRRGRVLCLYALLSYPPLFLNASLLAHSVRDDGLAPNLFFLGALVDSCLLYLLAAFLPVALAHAIAGLALRRPGAQRLAGWLVYALAVALPAALGLAIFVDRRIYEIFGFHVNGFVVNLIVTPGGIASMGGDEATTAAFGLVAVGFLALQAVLLAIALRVARALFARPAWLPRRALIAAVASLVALTLTERFGYAISDLTGNAAVLDAASVLPYYQPLTIMHIARSFGFHPERTRSPRFRVATDRLRYPLAPVARGEHRALNIVWLVAESLRADMLDAEIMPSTDAFAQRAVRFRRHYSGGNGTRMGMFSMFYGLYGSYWFPFLQQRRQPLLLDVLMEDHYQLGLFTSANFRYPEFDKTIFAGVPSAELHSFEEGIGWQRDRQNVGKLLEFIERRDPSLPFFAFMFFESPHARYHFPPESVIRRPYLEDLTYATMNLERDKELIFNRYVNACHHLDSQFARILEYLDRQGLLDSTIVLVTGDHGEAFLEKGRWGHGSDFSEEQTRVPLVLWIPGEAPREVTRMTSHVDVPATILPRLGVTNPPEDYSLGFDLLGERSRTRAVLADWNNLAVIDDSSKLIFPIQAAGFLQRRHATTAADEPLSAPDASALLEEKRADLLEVMHDLARFSGRG